VPARTTSSTRSPVGPGLPSAPGSLPKDAPVIAVTKTAILVRGAAVIELSAIPPGDSLPALVQALGKPTATTTAILQADAATDARLIARIVAATKAAGYDNLLFAVKSQ
jgi:biopolymer transport protein ExbD